MQFKMYEKVFYSAYNFSIFKTLLWNMMNFYTLRPKLYLGKKTSIINKGGSIIVDHKSFIDCKNSGQYFYDSHITLEKGSKIILGNNVNFFSGAQVKCFKNSVVNIGRDTYFSGPITIHSKEKVSIGVGCSIAWGVTILDSDFHSVDKHAIKTKEVVIEDNVWIGCNVTILKGVCIKKDCVIAAGSVVTKSTHSKGIYSGNPAKLLRELNE